MNLIGLIQVLRQSQLRFRILRIFKIKTGPVGVKEYSSKDLIRFTLDGVDLSTAKDIPTTTYETYSDYDTYDDVPTVNVDDLDY